MKKLIIALASGCFLIGAAQAAEGKRQFSEKQLAQQQVMRDCNASAKSQALKGADRKAFMKTCLSSGKSSAPASEAAPAAEGASSQKEKMKACNAEAKAKALKGADRKSFMSSCLAA